MNGAHLGRRGRGRPVRRRGPLWRDAEVLPPAVVGEVALRAERLEADLAVQRVQLHVAGRRGTETGSGTGSREVLLLGGAFTCLGPNS